MGTSSGTAEVVDLAAWKRRRAAPGTHSHFRDGDFVCRGREVGRIGRSKSTAFGRDIFEIVWEDGTLSSASHVNLDYATARQVANYGRPLGPEADGEGGRMPGPVRRHRARSLRPWRSACP